jgi:hypothetical protein
MFLVKISSFVGDDIICVVTETEEDAKHYIEQKMEGHVYSGLGMYVIEPIELYKRKGDADDTVS